MLRLEDLHYRHAHRPDWALSGLNLELPAGRALLVTGHSGSGKSTLLAVLSGLVPHYYKGELRGRVSLDGQEPARLSLADWGFKAALMTQNPEIQFLGSTVEEEILLTLRCRKIPEAEAAALAALSLERFGLKGLGRRSVFHLSEGQKQKVILAGLWALKPRLLLLDEPGANLDPAAGAELGRTLAALKAEGLSLVIADHRLDWLRDLADQVLVLRRGRAAAQGAWNLLEDEGLRKDLHLRPRPGPPPAEKTGPGPPEGAAGVELENLSFAWPGGEDLFAGLSGRLYCGRVTVLSGPSGRGKTTLARLLCGLEKPAAGRIRGFGGPGPAGGRFASQVVLQNTDHQLYLSSVRAEMELALAGGPPAAGETAERRLAEFGLAGLADRHPQSLSGGEKQRLTVALGLAGAPRLLVLDEPSSGLDGRNLELMAAQIRKAARKGPAVLVITHDRQLAALCADDYLSLET
ncbi:MAG: ABC transporter ATP-binding protein [Candidatus Adiutrix sp.]|jgi:energy-coupling factor transport system ATP-binding protein|nr:ABC transporter ATP-binding protein [Candidatus Adiutrix sp.]